MRERRSEVFEEYAKVAEKMGLVASEDADPKPKDVVHSPTPGVIDNKNNGADSWMRWDSQDISAPEAFYGVKPNKDLENGTKNIMEQAHPNSVVIAPSYDRMNGLVENNIERQKIIVNILMRDPTGNCNYRKLAQEAMLMELVRLGNQLDNAGEDELRSLADSCVERLANDVAEPEAKKDSEAELDEFEFIPMEMQALDGQLDASDENDVSPKGWGKTVEKMKKHKDLDNPFALAYWMKDQGYKPHPNKK